MGARNGVLALGVALALGCAGARLAEPQLQRAEMALAVGSPEDAIAAYRRALEYEPRNPEALHGLARAHVARGEAETALGIYTGLELGAPAYFESALRDYLEAVDRAAEGRLAAGDAAGALELLRRLQERDPGRAGVDPRIRAALLAEGARRVADGRVWEGEELFREVLEADPGSVEAVLGLAEALLTAGRVDDAIRVLSDASLAHPDDPRIDALMDRAIEIRYPSTPASPLP